MVNGVHGNATGSWPAVALRCELVLGSGCLCNRLLALPVQRNPCALKRRGPRTQQRLVRPPTTCHNADHSPDRTLHNLLRATRQLHPRLALIRVMAYDGHVIAAGAPKRATVTHLLLHVCDDGTLGYAAEREHIADGQGGVLARVDELARVHALVGDEGLLDQLVAVRMAEDDLREGGATARVVDYLLDDAADVAVALGVVESAELRRGFVEAGVCL